MTQLWVVMPVYNEASCIGDVIAEWMPVLRKEVGDFTLCLLNDGSKDNTLAVISELAQHYPELKVIDKPNSGHGQTCLTGYELALENGAEWVLQLDSDGQCDPSVFHQFWERKAKSSVVYGFRYPREDGIIRFLISRSVSVAILLGMGVWVWDPGVPYRLMHRTTLENILPLIPKDFYLVNILLAALQQKDHGIHWIRTRFRQRFSGSSSINGMAFIRQGWHLMKQVRSLKLIRHPASETREPVNF